VKGRGHGLRFQLGGDEETGGSFGDQNRRATFRVGRAPGRGGERGTGDRPGEFLRGDRWGGKRGGPAGPGEWARDGGKFGAWGGAIRDAGFSALWAGLGCEFSAVFRGAAGPGGGGFVFKGSESFLF